MKRTIQLYLLIVTLLFVSCKIIQPPGKTSCRECPNVIIDTVTTVDTLYLDTLFIDTLYLDTLYRDTLYLDTLYRDTLAVDTIYADTLIRYKKVFKYDELVRDIRDQIITASPDTTDFYSIKFSGISKADEIRVVPNCYDGVQNERFSIRLALQDSLADSLLPSNRTLETGEHYFQHITPDTLDCRGIMTYWIHAKKDTSEVLGIKYTDIGHRLFIGTNGN